MTSDPSGNASTGVLGTVTEPVRALLLQGAAHVLLEGARGRPGALGGFRRLRGQRPARLAPDPADSLTAKELTTAW
ncbi:hypothetical protein [Streptomyces sp. NBC_00342]|uniref:hypothetical protein n=1 Tax=Streptomyces sp. NBC_00342 TaxID=2975718 RepID=UPI002E2AF24E|nr:hypothetical protein [Streptomyces sp. NBC_00342]